MKKFVSNKITIFAPGLICCCMLFGFTHVKTADSATQTAVISTVQADFSGGAHSIISVDPIGGPRTVINTLLPSSVSDITVAAYGEYFFRIERLQADNVAKFAISEPGKLIWQFSTNDASDTVSSNPQDLIFVNAEKAYLPRFGSTKAWIVNPSATTEAEFKIGELDLSSYADSDDIPEMKSGIIADGRLYLIMQRLNRKDGLIPSNTSYIAVFDTDTDTEIDTKVANTDGVSGILLPVRNTNAVQYLAENKMLYVQGSGDFWSGRKSTYTGGIASIDTTTWAVTTVLDDGDDDYHPYGYISGMVIVNRDKGYFIGYAGWGDNSLYEFDPSTGNVLGIANAYLENKNIAGMESGAYADDNDLLWVCNSTDAEIVILNTADNVIDEKISTILNPTRVVFAGGNTTSDSSGESSSSSGCFIETGAKTTCQNIQDYKYIWFGAVALFLMALATVRRQIVARNLK